jgi:hypothetical protein
MAGSLASCTACSKPIPEIDLESGAAIAILGKSYCAACKAEAMKSISLEDLMRPAAERTAKPPPPKAVAAPPPPKAAPTPEKKAPPPQATPRPAPPGKTPPGRRAVPLPPRRSKATLVASLLVGAGAVLALVVLATSGKGPAKKPEPPPVADPGPRLPSPKPADLREAAAEEAYAKALTVSQRSDLPIDDALAAIDRAMSACRGTSFEAKLESLRGKVALEKEKLESSKGIDRAIADLRIAVAADKDFKRYGELQAQFQAVRERAAKAGGTAPAEVQELHREYSAQYERAAQPWYDEIKEAAPVLADEKRFDDALAKIDTFPAPLRHSGAWRELEKLRAEIARRKANFKK